MEPLTHAQQELYDWLVDYVQSYQHAPSIRQMMKAMNLRSPAPVQSRLERLRSKGYIDWTEGKARTLRITHQPPKGIPIWGAIAAGGLVEPFTDIQDRLDLSEVLSAPEFFALRVTGDSMIEDMIADGDIAILRSPQSSETPKVGEIVAARVKGYGTTLKRYYREGDKVTLQPANPNYQPILAKAPQVDIQGILVGVWRGY